MPPPAGNQGPSAEAQARRQFHFALAAILFVPVAPFVSGFFALLHARDPSHPYKARLAALAGIDVIVAGCVMWLSATGAAIAWLASGSSGLASLWATLLADTSRGAEQEPVVRASNALGMGVVLATMITLTVVARLRGASLRPGIFATLSFLFAAFTSTALSFGLLRGGLDAIGATLLAMALGSAAMGTVAALGARAITGPVVTSPISTLEALGRALLYAFGGGIRVGVLAATVSILLSLPRANAAEAFGVTASWTPLSLALFVVAAVIIAPLAEETLFRGLLMPWLCTWMSDRTALFVSSAAFAVGHLFYGANAVVTFAYGLAFGWARLATGNLRASMAAHACVNALAFAAIFAQRFLDG